MISREVARNQRIDLNDSTVDVQTVAFSEPLRSEPVLLSERPLTGMAPVWLPAVAVQSPHLVKRRKLPARRSSDPDPLLS